MQRWIVLRIDTDEPKVIASYADEEQADKTCETLTNENKGRAYLVVDSEVVSEDAYLY